MQRTIAEYVNGGYSVTLSEGGTKTRTRIDHSKPPAHPESIDVKITDYCNKGCPYCHESSTVAGIHGDLDALIGILSVLPRGVELAIGGGNPLSHPGLLDFLAKAKAMGFICNITVNQAHVFGRHPNSIADLVEKSLVYGVGISITDVTHLYRLQPFLTATPHVVFHVIAGIHNPDIIENLARLSPDSAILVLGYKQFGFGESYFSSWTEQLLSEWKLALPKYLGRYLLSFDNLAIEQLAVERLLTREAWSRLYMGDDFQFTMYIDAVKQEYAPTSRSVDRVAFAECGLIDYFARSWPGEVL
ncbi:MAG: radical SAM protein [Chroococcidiopsis sp.]